MVLAHRRPAAGLLHHSDRGGTYTSQSYQALCENDEVSPEMRHCLAGFDREHLAQDFFLQRLAQAEVDAMLRAIFAVHQAASTGLLESVYTLTEGNSFFHRGGAKVALQKVSMRRLTGAKGKRHERYGDGSPCRTS